MGRLFKQIEIECIGLTIGSRLLIRTVLVKYNTHSAKHMGALSRDHGLVE